MIHYLYTLRTTVFLLITNCSSFSSWHIWLLIGRKRDHGIIINLKNKWGKNSDWRSSVKCSFDWRKKCLMGPAKLLVGTMINGPSKDVREKCSYDGTLVREQNYLRTFPFLPFHLQQFSSLSCFIKYSTLLTLTKKTWSTKGLLLPNGTKNMIHYSETWIPLKNQPHKFSFSSFNNIYICWLLISVASSYFMFFVLFPFDGQSTFWDCRAVGVFCTKCNWIPYKDL